MPPGWSRRTTSSGGAGRRRPCSPLRYGLPTLPFVAGPSAAGRTVSSATRRLIDRVFASVDTDAGRPRLLHDEDSGRRIRTTSRRASTAPAQRHGHPVRRPRGGARRCTVVARAGATRRRARRLRTLGLTVRSGEGATSPSWRYDVLLQGLRRRDGDGRADPGALDVTVRSSARLGRPVPGQAARFRSSTPRRCGPAWPCSPRTAATTSSRPSSASTLDRPVYDLNVEDTHNFIAGGLVTHNSIYGFRGADMKNILNFEDDFVDAHVVKLEQNYRSTQTILSAANGVVANNRGRMTKALWTEIGEGDPIKVRELTDEHAEARYVAAEIERMVDEGVSREEIAVFYRTNAQSRVLEDMLVRAQIGYQVIGGTKFYERAEIRDAVAYLTFLANPQDAGAFTRVANSPKRGLGQTSLTPRALATPTRWASRCGTPPRSPTACRGSAPRRRRRSGASCRRWCACASGWRARAGRRPARRAAARDRLLRRAAGRADDRGAGPDREPRGARARRPRVRRDGRGGVGRRVPAADRADRRRRLAARRRGPRDADDAPQRQGPRVPDRVHDRDGGRRLPALARARRGRDRGGAAARLRRAHAGDARPHPHLRAPAHLVRRPTRSACARASSTRSRAS